MGLKIELFIRKNLNFKKLFGFEKILKAIYSLCSIHSFINAHDHYYFSDFLIIFYAI
jgi:hypothetical protein